MNNLAELIETAGRYSCQAHSEIEAGCLACEIKGDIQTMAQALREQERDLRHMTQERDAFDARIEELEAAAESKLTVAGYLDAVNSAKPIDDAEVDYHLNEIKGHRAFRDPDAATDLLLEKLLLLIERLAREERKEYDRRHRAEDRVQELKAEIERYKDIINSIKSMIEVGILTNSDDNFAKQDILELLEKVT